MHDVTSYVMCALGALAVAKAIAGGAAMALGTGTGALGGLASAAVAFAPWAILLGGAAYAASRIGFRRK